jgi:hypothetical protein
MNRTCIGLVFILLLGSWSQSLAQESQFSAVRDAYSEMAKKKDWIAFSKLEVFEGFDLFEIDKNISDYIGEYEVEQVYQEVFYAPKNNIFIIERLFVLSSQIKAFGFYSVDKTPSLNFLDIGYESYLYPQKLVSWYSQFVLFTETPDTTPELEKYLKEFAQEFIRLLPQKKKNTPILDCLPQKQRVRFSEKFSMRRWMDQEFFRNIYYADYYNAEGYSRIFIIDNLNTETADINFWQYRNTMKTHSTIINDTLQIQTDYFIVDDPLWGLTIMAKKNKIIYGILDYRNRKWAEERLSELLNELKKRNIVKSG